MSVDVKMIRSALDEAEFATPVYDDGVYVFGQDQEIRLAEVPGDDECRAIILLVNNARAMVEEIEMLRAEVEHLKDHLREAGRELREAGEEIKDLRNELRHAERGW